MISLKEREWAEKTRSALSASVSNPALLIDGDQVKRYLAPPANTIWSLEYAFHLLGDVRGKTVLEYGCGDGQNTVMLSRRGANVIALDISPELLALAKQRMVANRESEAWFVLGSAHTLPLPDNSVDVVFGVAVLHHLDLEVASREVHRVLKSGGRAIFKEPLRNSRLLARLRRLLPKRSDASSLEGPLTDQLIREFAGSCEHQSRNFQLYLSRLATLLPIWRSPVMNACNKIDALLLRAFPSLDYYGSVKVFQIKKR